MKLTEHFWLHEFTRSQTATREGIDNTPPGNVLANLEITAMQLERARTILGNRVIHVSSGYRSPELNRAVGGARASFHMLGLAADWTCPSFGTPLEVCKALVAAGFRFDQLIHEFGDKGWIHSGFNSGPAVWRMETLTAFRGPDGKTIYQPGLVPVD